MKKQIYLQFHKDFTSDMWTVTHAKNADYTGKSEDAFANLKSCEHRGLASTGVGILIRMDDKMSRLAALLQQPAQVKNESFRDTCLDLANYAALLAAWFGEPRAEPSQELTGMVSLGYGAKTSEHRPGICLLCKGNGVVSSGGITEPCSCTGR